MTFCDYLQEQNNRRTFAVRSSNIQVIIDVLKKNKIQIFDVDSINNNYHYIVVSDKDEKTTSSILKKYNGEIVK
jgi:hypothetical protein